MFSPQRNLCNSKKTSERFHLQRKAAEGGGRSRPTVPVLARRASSRRDSWPRALEGDIDLLRDGFYPAEATARLAWLGCPEDRQNGLPTVARGSLLGSNTN